MPSVQPQMGRVSVTSPLILMPPLRYFKKLSLSALLPYLLPLPAEEVPRPWRGGPTPLIILLTATESWSYGSFDPIAEWPPAVCRWPLTVSSLFPLSLYHLFKHSVNIRLFLPWGLCTCCSFCLKWLSFLHPNDRLYQGSTHLSIPFLGKPLLTPSIQQSKSPPDAC